MKNNRGTPKTLNEAINNALSDTLAHCNDQKVITAVVEVHVRDFLAQRFSVAVLKQDMFVVDEDVLTALWQSVIKVA